MTRHPATEGNKLAPSGIVNDRLNRLEIPEYDNPQKIPVDSFGKVSTIDGDLIYFNTGRQQDDEPPTQIGIEPSVITEGLFPQIFG